MKNDESEVSDARMGEIIEAAEQEDVREIIQAAMFQGPLPPPPMLADYESILPGTADRVLSMAEKEQEIRSRDNKSIIFNDTLRILGSIFVSVGLVAGAIGCAYLGFPNVAIALAATGAVPQVIRFFNRSSNKNSDE
jgi:uncharacterized membrane protein